MIADAPEIATAVAEQPLVLCHDLAFRDLDDIGLHHLLETTRAFLALQQPRATEGEEQVRIVQEVQRGRGVARQQVELSLHTVSQRLSRDAHRRARAAVTFLGYAQSRPRAEEQRQETDTSASGPELLTAWHVLIVL